MASSLIEASMANTETMKAANNIGTDQTFCMQAHPDLGCLQIAV